jgi:hypothetical protein
VRAGVHASAASTAESLRISATSRFRAPSAPRHWGVAYRHELPNTLTAAWADWYVAAMRFFFATHALVGAESSQRPISRHYCLYMYGIETDLHSSGRLSHALCTMGPLHVPPSRHPAEHLESVQTQRQEARPIKSADGGILEKEGD